MEKYIELANAMNLTFIRRAVKGEVSVKTYKDYSLFKFNDCGHEQFKSISKVRKGVFTCSECYDIKVKTDSEDAGLTFLSKDELSRSNLYKFNSCGHIQLIQVGHVRMKSFACRICTELKYDKEAKSKGLTLIRKDTETGEVIPYKGGARLYLFNKCKHIKSITINDVRNSSFICNECQILKVHNEGKLAGLTYLRNAVSSDMSTEIKNHGFYRFDLCGHEQPISRTAVRNKSFTCCICKQSSKYKTSYVYLYRIETKNLSWLKLGFSNNPEYRGKRYDISSDHKLTLLKQIKFITGEEANKYERTIHELFKTQRMSVEIMRNHMQSSGFTECYPLSLGDSIMSELLKINKSPS
jgi:hypothetical protein